MVLITEVQIVCAECVSESYDWVRIEGCDSAQQCLLTDTERLPSDPSHHHHHGQAHRHTSQLIQSTNINIRQTLFTPHKCEV